MSDEPVVAPGAAKLSGLQDGGFNTDEINQYRDQVSGQMGAAGFNHQEINDYWGIKTPDTTGVQKIAAEADQSPGALSPQNPAMRKELMGSYERGETKAPSEFLQNTLKSVLPIVAGGVKRAMHPLDTAEDAIKEMPGAVGASTSAWVGSMAFPFLPEQQQQDLMNDGILKKDGTFKSQANQQLFEQEFANYAKDGESIVNNQDRSTVLARMMQDRTNPVAQQMGIQARLGGGNAGEPQESTAGKAWRGFVEGEQGTVGTAMGGMWAIPSAVMAPAFNEVLNETMANVPKEYQDPMKASIGIAMDMAGMGGLAHLGKGLIEERAASKQFPAGTGPWDKPQIPYAPKAQDFPDAAIGINGNKAEVEVSQVLRNIYAETGIHPAQVAADAKVDPTIAQDLAAGQVPKAYAGYREVGKEEVLQPGQEIKMDMATGKNYVKEPELEQQMADLEKKLDAGEGNADEIKAQMDKLADQRIAEMNAAPRPGNEATAPKAAGSVYEMVTPSQLTLAPDRFQYKASEAGGVTGALGGTTKWEPALANPITVWQGNDGKMYVVNGHQRFDLATRAEAAGQKGVEMPARVYKESEGYSPEYMRTLGAFQNIAEGSGTAIDAAKVLRNGGLPEDRRLPSLPPKSQLVQQAHGLAALDDTAFGMVVNDIVPASYGAEVGHAITDPKEQLAAMDVLAKSPPANLAQARMMVEDIKNSGFLHGDQTSLFGDAQIAQSLFAERSRILDNAIRQLRQLKAAFTTSLNMEGALTEVGNVLSTEANEKAKVTNEKIIAELQANATRKGPISDALTDAARGLKSGKPIAAVTKQFLDGARAAASRPGNEGVRPGAAAGGNGPAQSEIPGAGRITDRELAERKMEGAQGATAPQKPADDGLFDVAGRSQKSLFQRGKAFYSALERNIDALPQGKATADQWAGIIKNLAAKGIKQEEIDWSGVQDWLKEQKGAVTKEQLMKFLRDNAVDVQEVTKQGKDPNAILDDVAQREYGKPLEDLSIEEARHVTELAEIEFKATGDTKFASHTLPGGENYRELLLTLPEKPVAVPTHGRIDHLGNGKYLVDAPGLQRTLFDTREEAEAETRRLGEIFNRDRAVKADRQNFRGAHFNEPNVLAHIRFNDRVGPNGEKILHIEEVQSDWHQRGRDKGYANEADKAAVVSARNELRDATDRLAGLKKTIEEQKPGTPLHDKLRDNIKTVIKERDAAEMKLAELEKKQFAVPDAPFKKTWPELAMKRMLRYAAENGYDKLTWTTGGQQADRYDLSKEINSVETVKTADGKYMVVARDKANRAFLDAVYEGAKLPEILGKELAQKIVDAGAGRHKFEGVDLKVGGEGMKGFYDKILPNFMSKYAKKWDAKVGKAEIGFRPEDDPEVLHMKELFGANSPQYRGSLKRAESRSTTYEVHSVDITPAMRESVMGGQPLFHRGAGGTEMPENAIKVAPGVAAVPKTLFTANEAKIATAINAEAQRLLGGKAITKVAAKLFSTGEEGAPGEVQGYANRIKFDDGEVRHLVYASMASDDAIGTVRHEAIHALRRGGLTGEEWSTLQDAAEKGGWIDQHKVATRWSDLDHEQQLEEAVAEEFSKNRREDFKGAPAAVRPIFQKIAKFFDAIADQVRQIIGAKATAQDIFSRIESGEVGKRGDITGDTEGRFLTPEERILEKISVGGDRRERTPLSWDNFYKAAVDKLDPIRRITEALQNGNSGDVLRDTYKLMRNLAGNYGRAQGFIEQHTFDFKTYKNNGKSLKEILAPVNDDLNSFRAYAASRRAIELEARNIKSGMPIADANSVVAAGAKKFEPIFKELNGYQDAVLKYLKDSGVLTDEQVKAMKGANNSYVPFYRVMDEESFGTPGGAKVKNPIKRIKGSDRDIIDPIESIVRNTYSYIAIAERNAALKSFFDLASKSATPDDYFTKQKPLIRPTEVSEAEMDAFLTKQGITQLPTDTLKVFRAMRTPLARDEIGFFDDGKWTVLKVDPDLAEAFNGTPRGQHGLLFKMIAAPAKMLRYGLVTPEFILRHLERNTLSATVIGSKAKIPFENLYKGIFSYLQKDAAYEDWLKSGGKVSALSGVTRDDVTDEMHRLVGEAPETNYLSKAWNIVKYPFDLIHAVQQSLENMNRLGAYKQAMVGLNVDKPNIVDAGYYSRNVAPDPSRIGTHTGLWNAVTALANTEIQHTAQLVDALRTRPIPTLAKGFAFITLPTLINWAVNHNTQEYKETPAWERDAFWIMPVGGFTLRIPKPFFMGFLFATVPERIMDAISGNDPHGRGMEEMIKDMFEQATPNTVPTALMPILEQITNHSMFRKMPLVPDHLMQQLPEYRYSEYTSELTKGIGRLVGKVPFVGATSMASPIVIDNYLRAWTGSLGTYVKDAMDASLRKAGVLPDPLLPASKLADIPFIKAFVTRYPSAQAESIQRFQEDYRDMAMVTNTYKALLKQGEIERAREVALNNPTAFTKLDQLNRTINEQNQLVRALYKNPTIPADQKRQLIDATYMQMIQVAGAGNMLMEALRQQAPTTRH